MEILDQKKLALLATSLTVVIVFSMSSGFSTFTELIVGLVLATCLWKFRTKPLDPRMIRPLSMIWGVCILLVLGVFIDAIYLAIEKDTLIMTNKAFNSRTEPLFWARQPLWPRDIFDVVLWIIATAIAYRSVRRLKS